MATITQTKLVGFGYGNKSNYNATAYANHIWFDPTNKQILLNGIEYIPKKLSELVNDKNFLTSITKSMVENVLTGNITTHKHSYLPLSGGTLTGSLKIDYTNIQSIIFKNNRIIENSGGWADSIIDVKDASNTDVFHFAIYGNNNSLEYAFLGVGIYDSNNLRIYSNKVAFGNNEIYHKGNLTKSTIEGLLTGTISSHTHTFSSITSKPTTLSGYGITNAMSFETYDAWSYVNASFSNSSLAQKAANSYIEFWQSSSSWFNLKAGKFITNGGTSAQFLKGDGSLDSNTYALASDLSKYLPLTGGTLSGDITFSAANKNIGTSSVPLSVLWTKGVSSSTTLIIGAGTSVMTFDKDGNVAIGKSSVSKYKLDVSGSIYSMSGGITSADGFIKLGSSDSYVLLAGGGTKAVSDFATSAVATASANGLMSSAMFKAKMVKSVSVRQGGTAVIEGGTITNHSVYITQDKNNLTGVYQQAVGENDVKIPNATKDYDGSMSYTDKRKIEAIFNDSGIYNSVWEISESKMEIESGIDIGAQTELLDYWQLPMATTSLCGLMTGTDKRKLDGISPYAPKKVVALRLSYTSGSVTVISGGGDYDMTQDAELMQSASSEGVEENYNGIHYYTTFSLDTTASSTDTLNNLFRNSFVKFSFMGKDTSYVPDTVDIKSNFDGDVLYVVFSSLDSQETWVVDCVWEFF